MKKSRVLSLVIVLSFVLLLSFSFVSASWFSNIFGKITGRAISDLCTDSDGGLNYYVKGSAEGYLFLDSNETGIREDQCAQKRFEGGKFVGWNYVPNCEENCGISESFCRELSSGKTTADSLEFECPGKCKNGACIQETNISCIDSDKILSNELDDGLNYYKKGIVTIWENGQISKNESDYCIGNSGELMEFVCDNNKVESVNYNCSNGCEDGKCIEPTGCIDSDDGDNIYEKGYRINWDRTYEDYGRKQEDYCIKNPTILSNGNITADGTKKVSSCEGEDCYLIEYHCQKDLSDAHSGFPCPNGCEDGKCINSGIFYENYEYLVNNGNPADKLDVFFIPFNISNDFFHELMDKMIYSDGRPVNNICGNVEARGLLKIEPFKSNPYKFNIEYSNKSLDLDYFNCFYYGEDPFYSKLYMSCDWNKLKQNIPFESDIIVIAGKDFRTVADQTIILFGDTASADPTTPINSGFEHEFAHAFGGLTDEYTYSFTYNCQGENCYYVTRPDPCVNSEDSNCFSNIEKEIKFIPNEDVVGCPKWCEDYNKTKLMEISKECTQIKNMRDCLSGGLNSGGCLWFNQKHPWFNASCIPRIIRENIGINCTSQCILGQHYGHIGFSPDCSEGGLMKNNVGDFNPVSIDHLSKALNCCFPPQNTLECKEFSEKFKFLEGTYPYFKFAYDKFSNCFAGNSYQEAIVNQSIEEDKVTEDNLNESCIGCLFDDKCYPFNYRKDGEYCSIEQKFVSQLEVESSCNNNFECSSNLCIDSQCVSSELWQKFLKWLSSIFG